METNRIQLRKLVEEDAKMMFDNWANDPEVTKYLTWNPHKYIDTTKTILQTWIKEYEKPDTHKFGIVYKENNQLIGMISVGNYVDGNPEIGYVLSRKYWNQGIMSEVLQLFMHYLHQKKYQTLCIRADVENIGSNRVIIKNGFEYIETKNELVSSVKPIYRNINYYQYVFKNH